MGTLHLGGFHRLAIAVRQGDVDVVGWLAKVLGAEVSPGEPEPGDEHLTIMVRTGSVALAVFAAPGPTGNIGRYVERHGPGLHSVAWHADDLWVAENVVRERGVTITGTNIAARHFFMHPRETFGILTEFTDHTPPRPFPPAPVAIAWITAVVRDPSATATFFEELCGATRVAGLPSGSAADEVTVDLQISDVVLRLVSPLTDESRYAGFLRDTGERLHSLALRVADLGFPEAAGLDIAERDDDRVWTDPASTLGLRLEWVAS